MYRLVVREYMNRRWIKTSENWRLSWGKTLLRS